MRKTSCNDPAGHRWAPSFASGAPDGWHTFHCRRCIAIERLRISFVGEGSTEIYLVLDPELEGEDHYYVARNCYAIGPQHPTSRKLWPAAALS